MTRFVGELDRIRWWVALEVTGRITASVVPVKESILIEALWSITTEVRLVAREMSFGKLKMPGAARGMMYSSATTSATASRAALGMTQSAAAAVMIRSVAAMPMTRFGARPVATC